MAAGTAATACKRSLVHAVCMHTRRYWPSTQLHDILVAGGHVEPRGGCPVRARKVSKLHGAGCHSWEIERAWTLAQSRRAPREHACGLRCGQETEVYRPDTARFRRRKRWRSWPPHYRRTSTAQATPRGRERWGRRRATGPGKVGAQDQRVIQDYPGFELR